MPKTGLTFAPALRSFLRQDPDVIMVGEIRDLETAEIAIKAAQTGHLVLSTLHTNSAADADAPAQHGHRVQHRHLGRPDHRPAPGAQTVQPLQETDGDSPPGTLLKEGFPEARIARSDDL